MYKKLLFIPLLLLFALLTYLSPRGVVAQECVECGDHKVTICHRRNSNSNPYGPKAIEVDKNSTVDGHDDHNGPVWYKGIDEKWGDIIPPFEYKEKVCRGDGRDRKCRWIDGNYEGKNWTTAGQAIWNNDCQIPEYKECSSTVRVTRGWSEWQDDPQDETQEMRKKIVYIVDSQDRTVQCAKPVELVEYRYKECSRTVRSFGDWSEWMDDPQDETQEYRERNAYAVDSQNTEVICVGPIVQTETRDKEVEYEQCEFTNEVPGDWSDWAVDPTDDSREFRERIISLVDAEDGEISCGENKETEYRDIEEEGEVLGTTDTGEVLGTSIVYAETAGGSDLMLVQYALMVLTGFSFIFVGRKYLTM